MFNRPKEFDPELSAKTMKNLERPVIAAFDAKEVALENSTANASAEITVSKVDIKRPHQAPTLNPDLLPHELAVLNSRLSAALGAFSSRSSVVERGEPLPVESVSRIVRNNPESNCLPLARKLKTDLGLLRTEVLSVSHMFRTHLTSLNSAFGKMLNSTCLPLDTGHISESVSKIRSDLDGLRNQVFLVQDSTRAMTLETAVILLQGVGKILSSETQFLKDKLKAETALRRKLHNTVLELKGNIRVFVRVRPLIPREVACCISSCVFADSDSELRLSRSGQTRTFTFDRVFDQSTENGELFSELHQLLISALDGFNVAILAYGITGSGKTFTMEGIYERLGLDLFHERVTRETSGGWKYAFEGTVFEVYNETIIDLLNLKNLDCALRTNPNTGLFFLPGLTRIKIESPGDVSKLISNATKNRSVSSTNCNEQSSRSHLVTTFHVAITTPSLKQLDAKMSLVDLAGSERLDKSGATGAVAKEGMFINKSLSALGDVINARVNKAGHVPYRNSVLTSALQDCIAGESKTLMILQVNPSEESVEETLNSVVFASRVKDVELTKTVQSPRRRA